MVAPPVRYVWTPDGFNIAYTEAGRGSPFLLLPFTVSHQQLIWRPENFLSNWLRAVEKHFHLVTYDSRGLGMSTRGLELGSVWSGWLTDLETIMDNLGLEQPILMADAGQCHVAIRYVVKHPERVRALILHRAFTSAAERIGTQALGLAKTNWEFFLQMQSPPGTPLDDVNRNSDFIRAAVTQSDWLLAVREGAKNEIGTVLPTVCTPALILHPRAQLWTSEEESAAVAAGIPGAKLVGIDTLYYHSARPESILEVVEDFLANLDHQDNDPSQASDLSAREMDVLRLLATGKSNREIAADLVISANTVGRHVSNILAKTDSANRAEATAYGYRNHLL